MLPIITICGTINKIELRYLANGKAVCSFHVECSEKNAKGEWENLYIKGAVFEKSAEFVQKYFNDGDACIATGKLVTEIYENKEGKKVYDIKLKFPQISFVPKSKTSEEPRQKPKVTVVPTSGEEYVYEDDDSSSIPFC